MSCTTARRVLEPRAVPLRPSIRFMIRVSCLLLFSACGSQPQDATLEFSGISMGTGYTVKLLPPADGIDTASLGKKISAILESVDTRMSTYLPGSELSRLNSNPSLEWIPVSPELFTVLQLALEVSRITNGTFDITVGRLVNLWGFGPEQVPETIPDEGTIRREAEKTGYFKLRLDAATSSIRKTQPDLYIDLSGIAQGYAADRVADALDAVPVENYLIDVSGEIRASGHNGSGQEWRIGIEKPDSGVRTVKRIIELRRSGMATSGDYRNFYIRNGKRYAHIIDPRTGHPIEHQLASVSVLHESAALADALATGLLVLGTEPARTLAEQNGIAAYFLTRSGEGFTESYTPLFAPYLAGDAGE